MSEVRLTMADFIPCGREVKDVIREHVPDGRPVLIDELAALAGVHKGTIRNHLADMPDLCIGYVKVNGRRKAAVARIT